MYRQRDIVLQSKRPGDGNREGGAQFRVLIRTVGQRERTVVPCKGKAWTSIRTLSLMALRVLGVGRGLTRSFDVGGMFPVWLGARNPASNAPAVCGRRAENRGAQATYSAVTSDLSLAVGL